MIQVFGRSPRVFYFPDEMQERFIDARSKLGDMFHRVSVFDTQIAKMVLIAAYILWHLVK